MLTPRHLMQPSVLWLTPGGLGFLRPGPGTWGSLGALVLSFAIAVNAHLASR